MEKRKILFGTYDTAEKGWTLTGWQLTAPEMKTNYIDKPGGDGAWDLSTALTDGLPRYSDRQLTATFECSEGDRLSREATIREMVNLLDGLPNNIILPDDNSHYIVGRRLHVARDYNDPAHAAITVTAICDPWKYANTEIIHTKTATTAEQSWVMTNSGRRAVVPMLTVTGTNASIKLTYGMSSLTLSAGTYQWPELLLTPGLHSLRYSGTGTLKVTYREAVLE